MTHKQDWIETVRGWVIPKLGIFAQWLEDITGDKYYVESTTHNNQFVGRVNMKEGEFEEVLHDMGFHRNPLAAWKSLESNPDNEEEGSWRKIGFDGDEDKQLHVILYKGSNMQNGDNDYIYVYAHWEYRWDTDPWKHYKGGHGVYSGAKGVKKMKNYLDEKGIEYELVRP